jgi:hypothetical protein
MRSPHIEVRGNHELDMALLDLVACLHRLEYKADQIEVQQRLAALELDLQIRRRRLKHEFDSTNRGRLAGEHQLAAFVVADQ